MAHTTNKLFGKLPKNRVNVLVAVVLGVVIVAAGYLTYRSIAAGFFAALEGEQGTITGNASLVNDASASGGKAISFNAPATPPPPPPTGSCTTVGFKPGDKDPWGTCWPNASTTGIPAGTVLSAYTGGCTVTANNTVINAKTVTCDPMLIRAANVQITKSKINGSVLIESPNAGYSFTITDTEVYAGPISDTDDDSAIGKSNFTATRVNTHGGKRGIWCEYSCTVQDSWVHDQAHDPSGRAHESGIRMGDGATIKHNSIWCNAPDYPPDAGCSANLTGYGDFAPIRNNTIEKNLFVATTGGTCAYGGSSGDDGSKPYGNQASNIKFIDNIFQRGQGGKCGYYFPITDFDSTRPGNLWQNNKWDDGATLPPAN